MVQLNDKDTGAGLGTITDAQFQFLRDHLEEEAPDDTDYYLTTETVDLLEEEGADPALVKVLRAALGGRAEIEIRWTQS